MLKAEEIPWPVKVAVARKIASDEYGENVEDVWENYIDIATETIITTLAEWPGSHLGDPWQGDRVILPYKAP